MSNDGVNHGRRRFLIAATSAVGGAGVVGAAVPFVASWNPSEKAKAAGAPVKADISQLEEGQQIVVEWRGKPVFIVRRSAEMLETLSSTDDKVSDPESAQEQQPAYAQNKHRSIKPEILVLTGVCTHLGCAPKFRPDVKPEPFDSEWTGGYFCPCHGSKFDMAGRVYSGVPAPTNLEVPVHSYLDDNVIIIGVDEENS